MPLLLLRRVPIQTRGSMSVLGGEFCVSRLLWNAVSRKIGVAFDATTLSDLCNASRRGRAGARRSLING